MAESLRKGNKILSEIVKGQPEIKFSASAICSGPLAIFDVLERLVATQRKGPICEHPQFVVC